MLFLWLVLGGVLTTHSRVIFTNAKGVCEVVQTRENTNTTALYLRWTNNDMIYNFGYEIQHMLNKQQSKISRRRRTLDLRVFAKVKLHTLSNIGFLIKEMNKMCDKMQINTIIPRAMHSNDNLTDQPIKSLLVRYMAMPTPFQITEDLLSGNLILNIPSPSFGLQQMIFQRNQAEDHRFLAILQNVIHWQRYNFPLDISTQNYGDLALLKILHHKKQHSRHLHHHYNNDFDLHYDINHNCLDAFQSYRLAVYMMYPHRTPSLVEICQPYINLNDSNVSQNMLLQPTNTLPTPLTWVYDLLKHFNDRASHLGVLMNKKCRSDLRFNLHPDTSVVFMGGNCLLGHDIVVQPQTTSLTYIHELVHVVLGRRKSVEWHKDVVWSTMGKTENYLLPQDVFNDTRPKDLIQMFGIPAEEAFSQIATHKIMSDYMTTTIPKPMICQHACGVMNNSDLTVYDTIVESSQTMVGEKLWWRIYAIVILTLHDECGYHNVNFICEINFITNWVNVFQKRFMGVCERLCEKNGFQQNVIKFKSRDKQRTILSRDIKFDFAKSFAILVDYITKLHKPESTIHLRFIQLFATYQHFIINNLEP
jgi:hypothetical protein